MQHAAAVQPSSWMTTRQRCLALDALSVITASFRRQVTARCACSGLGTKRSVSRTHVPRIRRLSVDFPFLSPVLTFPFAGSPPLTSHLFVPPTPPRQLLSRISGYCVRLSRWVRFTQENERRCLAEYFTCAARSFPEHLVIDHSKGHFFCLTPYIVRHAALLKKPRARTETYMRLRYLKPYKSEKPRPECSVIGLVFSHNTQPHPYQSTRQYYVSVRKQTRISKAKVEIARICHCLVSPFYLRGVSGDREQNKTCPGLVFPFKCEA